MSTYNTNYEIAQAINQRIGTAPVPFEDLRNISFQIYQELGGGNSIEDFDDIYQLLLTTRSLAREGGVGLIDDTSVRTDKTWSSDKINTELSEKQDKLIAGENIDITDNTISAVGYKFNGGTNGGFAEKYKQDAADGGQIVENTATGSGSHAEGYSTTASGDYGSHAEGAMTRATGQVAHAEGATTKASEFAAHAEGGETEATAYYAHAEGYQTKALGKQSHAEGGYTKAKGLRAHAEGEGSSADNICAVGDDSHTEGLFTQAQNYAEHAQGTANVSHKTASNAATEWQGDGNHTLHSIGNGRYTNTQSNAVEVMQNADVYIKGVGSYDGVHIKSEAGYETVKTLQQVINGKQDTLTAGQNIVITNNTISAVIDAGFNVEVVQTLPESGEANTIYFVTKEGGANPNVYDEYMYINNAWEKIGSTEVDLSNYYNKTEVDILLSGKQDKLTAGNNITINGNTISANDTTYSASDNIDITNNAIKAVGYRYNTTNGAFAEGDRDIVEGETTRHQSVATGVMAHAEGCDGTASGNHSHTEGNLTNSVGNNSHAEGYTTTSTGTNSHAEGNTTTTNGEDSHTEGYLTETGGNYTINTKTAGGRSVAGAYAHAEGNATIANGAAAHSEGRLTLAKGFDAHAEGYNTIANGNQTHAEGFKSKANSSGSHAEGNNTVTNGYASHAEGYNTEVGGNYTTNTKTAGTATGAGAYAHAEGNATIANGVAAHSEGYKTLAKGVYSHAEGQFTLTTNIAEHAQGSYNKSHTDDTADGLGTNGSRTIHSIGIGTAEDARKNAVEVMQNGDIYVYGLGNYDGTTTKLDNPSVMTLQDILKTIADNIGVDIGVLV